MVSNLCSHGKNYFIQTPLRHYKNLAGKTIKIKNETGNVSAENIPRPGTIGSMI